MCNTRSLRRPCEYEEAGGKQTHARRYHKIITTVTFSILFYFFENARDFQYAKSHK